MPSREQLLNHPEDSGQDLHQDASYKSGTTWTAGCWMSVGMEIRRHSGPRLGSGGTGSIEYRNSGPEES